MSEIRMIGMDFDLTLIGYGKGGAYVPQETQDLLVRCAREGREIGIVSGRVPGEMRELLERVGMRWADPFPTFYISRESYLFWNVGGAFVPDEEWNRARAAEMAVLARTLCEKTPQWLDALAAEGLVPKFWILWGDYCLELHFPTIDESERARVLLVEMVRDVPLARAHRNRFMAHVLLSTGGKGRTLAHAARTKGIDPGEVLAVGDTLNDMDMLDGRFGLHSGAVGNADEALKEAVRRNGGFVAAGHAGAGLAEVIRSYLH